MARKIIIQKKQRLRLVSLGEKPSNFFTVKVFDKGSKLYEKNFASRIKAESFAKSTKKRFKRMNL